MEEEKQKYIDRIFDYNIKRAQDYINYYKSRNDELQLHNNVVLLELYVKYKNIFLNNGDFSQFDQDIDKRIELVHTCIQFFAGNNYFTSFQEKLQHPVFSKLIQNKYLQDPSKNWIISQIFTSLIIQDKNFDKDLFLKFLRKEGFSIFEVVKLILQHGHHSLKMINRNEENFDELTNFTHFLMTINPKEYIPLLMAQIRSNGNSQSPNLNPANVLYFLLNFQYAFFEDKFIEKFVNYEDYTSKNRLNLKCVEYLLKKDNVRFGPVIVELSNSADFKKADELIFFEILVKEYDSSQSEKLHDLALQYLFEQYKKEIFSNKYERRYEIRNPLDNNESMSVHLAKYFISNDINAQNIFLDYVRTADVIFISFLQFIEGEYRSLSLPILIEALAKDSRYVEANYFQETLKLIAKHDYLEYKNEVLEKALEQNSKKGRDEITAKLSELGNKIIPDAIQLLGGKLASQRICGALILSKIDDSSATTPLYEVFNNEKNDDTRDIILDVLEKEVYGESMTLETIKSAIAFAQGRGKLNKFGEKAFAEEDLPPIYWINGDQLNDLEIRFLFYRMTRSKGQNSDFEVRQMIKFIDKERSGAFSKFMLKIFLDSDANSKYKHYISISSMLGGNESVAQLNALFRKGITDKRVKLAEAAIDALSLVGTNKALRSLEVISRKIANKKPRLSVKALDAMKVAAEEMNITLDELSDRIIPDFDFDGLFKSFDVDGVEYRAFIQNDFTFNYFDEDNKLRKSLPKNVDKETKTFFTEATRELKEVVKTVDLKIINYLYENRKWSDSEWISFFTNHPIMIIYASKLLWINYDINGRVLDTFRCMEDGELTDVENEEISLEENSLVTLYHPLFVDNELNDKWKSKLYEDNFVTLFPQASRTFFIIDESLKELNYSNLFMGMEVPKGADFTKSFMEKRGYYKSSGDGGSLNFAKIFVKEKIRVEPYIEGPNVWFQQNIEKAFVEVVTFYQMETNTRLKLGEVPPLIFSETMNDLDQLIKAI